MIDVLRTQRANPPPAVAAKAARAAWHLSYHSWEHLGERPHASAFLAWMHSIPSKCMDCRASLVYLQWLAKTIADRATAYDCRRAVPSYRNWFRDGPAAGVSKMHRMTRIVGGWVPSTVGKIRVDSDPPPSEPQLTMTVMGTK